MALYDAAFAKYFGPRITRFEKDTTEKEIIEVYRDWAPEYNKVYQLLIPGQVCLTGNPNSYPHALPSIKKRRGSMDGKN